MLALHLELADRLGYIKEEDKASELIERYDRLGKKLTNLRDNWRNYPKQEKGA